MSSLVQAKGKMEDALEALRREFTTIRTGKASSAMLDSVRVEAWGGRMPVNQVATISIPEPSLIVLQPFDRSLTTAIERAIIQSGIGLNPANDGTVIRLPIPPLNQERREEFVKVLHRMAEEARVAVRLARQHANDDVKSRLKDSALSEDEGRREMDEIQKLTDDFIRRIKDLLEAKEREVRTV